ncbi:phosphoribosylamine--glycine ligase [bacterium]|nr:phosphoribosylamine--glycine ligase [bacterium]
MNVLVIGGGGREHAIIWKIAQSPKVDKIYCAPGNGGISKMASCVDIGITDIKGLISFARKKKIDLTIVGPELPLTLGIVDKFQENDLRIFGPTGKAAELEGSKAFAKGLMEKYNIPTAAYETFTDSDKAVAYVHAHEPPFVLKADGLAAGKGVIICQNRAQAFNGIEQILKDKAFGEAGAKLVIEDFLQGEEVSILAITDGEDMVILPPAQDHKAIFEGDEGPNTGGMGAYAPAPLADEKLMKHVEHSLLRPMLDGLKAEGRPYKGVLYAGLMITPAGPKVLEFNCRFGDPETQPLLALMESDLIELFEAVVDGNLSDYELKIAKGYAICVVMASGGYPGAYEKGKAIIGLDCNDDDTMIFHAGTAAKAKGIVTSGGRVLGITGTGKTLQQCMQKVYETVSKITFDGAYYRRDIGQKALHRLRK